MKDIQVLDLKLQYDQNKADIQSSIEACLQQQQWILGPQVQALEEAIATYLNTRYCIGVSSGTEALVIALRAIAMTRYNSEYFSKDQEILTVSFTFTATGDAILRSGGLPVFFDINPFSYTLNIHLLEEYIQKSKKVVGIMPVHLYGYPCDMDPLLELAEKYKLFILEDTAQAFGSEYKNKKLSSIGIAGAHSFFPTKNLGGYGDGGMISTNDSAIAETSRMLLKHGGKDKYNVDFLGYNARLDTLQATVLLAKLKSFQEQLALRQKNSMYYLKKLSSLEELVLPHIPKAFIEEGSVHSYNQFTVRVKDGKRDALQKFLASKQIASTIYYPTPLHKMKLFKDRSLQGSELTITEHTALEVLSIPIEPYYGEDVFEYIVECIFKFFS
jgi:dTDP-4-amino-4,6-dideoxygalactose transaminase